MFSLFERVVDMNVEVACEIISRLISVNFAIDIHRFFFGFECDKHFPGEIYFSSAILHFSRALQIQHRTFAIRFGYLLQHFTT